MTLTDAVAPLEQVAGLRIVAPGVDDPETVGARPVPDDEASSTLVHRVVALDAGELAAAIRHGSEGVYRRRVRSRRSLHLDEVGLGPRGSPLRP